MAGGPTVNISQGGAFETDTKVYANGKDAYTNLHVRNLADQHYDLLANTTRLSDGAIIGKLTTGQVHSMFTGGTSPFTRYNPEGYTSDINKQLLATYKGLGGKEKYPTKEEYDGVVQKAVKPYITGFNSAINMAAGTDIVKNMDMSDSRNVNKALNFFNRNLVTEEEEAEEGRAMQEYTKEYETVEHSKQLGTLPPPAPVPLPPQLRPPPPSSDPITDHPGSTADTPVGDTDWYV